MEKLILTDVDGVLLWWSRAFEVFVVEELKWDIPTRLEDFYIIEDWLDIHPDEANDLVRKFHETTHMSCIPPMPGVQENIQKLVEHGYRFVAITACGASDLTYRMRLQNLSECFGDIFDAIHMVGVHESKAIWLSKYEPTIYVEDTARHANTAAEIGHTAFLINYPHNRKNETHPDVRRVPGWGEIVNSIIGGCS